MYVYNSARLLFIFHEIWRVTFTMVKSMAHESLVVPFPMRSTQKTPWGNPYPLVMSNIAIENDHRNSGFSHWKWWIFPVRFLGQLTRPGHLPVWSAAPSATGVKLSMDVKKALIKRANKLPSWNFVSRISDEFPDGNSLIIINYRGYKYPLEMGIAHK